MSSKHWRFVVLCKMNGALLGHSLTSAILPWCMMIGLLPMHISQKLYRCSRNKETILVFFVHGLHWDI